MAYEGGIEFLESPYGKFMFFALVEVDSTDETVLIVCIWKFKKGSLAQEVILTTYER